MDGPDHAARIYSVNDAERQRSAGGTALVTADGVRHDIPQPVFAAVMHVVDAMHAGVAVKVIPLRPELPVDDAAEAIGIRADIVRKYVANGTIPFRSTEYTDWVRLQDVITFADERQRMRSEGLRKLLNEDPWDEDLDDGTTA